MTWENKMALEDYPAMTMANKDIIRQPIPQPVMDAIDTIADYLRAGCWVECLIHTDGASFRLESIYDFVHVLSAFEGGE